MYRFRFFCASALLAAVLWGGFATRHWPLVGDASLMHYVVFLMRRGEFPYKNIVDINFPGTYLFDALSMKVFGDGAAGLRAYDLSLLAMLAVASLAVAGKKRWFGGWLASGLFALVHLQDGVAQQGQRDLVLATITVFGFYALRAGGGGRATASESPCCPLVRYLA